MPDRIVFELMRWGGCFELLHLEGFLTLFALHFAFLHKHSTLYQHFYSLLLFGGLLYFRRIGCAAGSCDQQTAFVKVLRGVEFFAGA